jgi:hypothetical protein
MKFYQTKAQTGADSFKATWSASSADASKQRTALKAEGFKKPVTTEHDVPTSKADLLAWLNDNKVTV